MRVATMKCRRPNAVEDQRTLANDRQPATRLRKNTHDTRTAAGRVVCRREHRRAGLIAVSELALIGTILAFAYWGASSLVSLPSDDSASDVATARACSDHPVYRLWTDSTGNRLWAYRPTTEIAEYNMTSGDKVDVRDTRGSQLAMSAQSRDGAVSLQLTHNNALYLDTIQGQTGCLAQTNHRITIVDLAVSQAGSLALAAQSDGSILGWSLDGAHVEAFRYQLANQRLVRMVLDGAGQTVCGAFLDGTVVFHDARTGRQLFGSLKLDSGCTAAVWSSDGRHVALATVNGNLSLFDVASGQPVWTAEPNLRSSLIRVTSLGNSADGRWLAATGLTNEFLIWDVTTPDFTRRLSGHVGIVRTIAFSSSSVYTGGLDGTVREWSLESFTPLRKWD